MQRAIPRLSDVSFVMTIVLAAPQLGTQSPPSRNNADSAGRRLSIVRASPFKCLWLKRAFTGKRVPAIV